MELYYKILKICFDSTGKILVMSIKRFNQENEACALLFWEELNSFDFHLNTRVENIHGSDICKIIYFETQSSQSIFFYFILNFYS